MAAPVVDVIDTIVSESDGYVDFVIRLSAPSTQAVKVNYITAIGSAYDDYRGPDYAYPGAQTLNFAPGETVKTVRVALFDDTTAEGTESFYLNLYAPTNGVLGKSQGTATIVDNDAAKGTPVLSVTDTVVDEKTGRAYITLTLDKPSASTVSVTVATADGSAVAGTDYQALPSQTVGFAPGEMSKTIAVNLIDDASAESGEFFNLVLSGASGATLPDNRAIVSIGASDAPTAAAPTVSVSDTVVSEKQGYAEFVVTLSAPSTQAVKVNYITAIGSAYDDYRGPDYAYPGAQTLNFAPGETVKTVRVALFDDTTAEGTESFYLNLYAPTNGVLGKSQGTATIVDNDAAKGTPVLSVTDTVVDEKTGRAYITLTLDKPSASTVSVTVATADGSAVAGTDYQALPSQTVGFAPGEMSKTIAVNLIDDASAESGEFFNLVLSGASGATLPDNRAIVSIGASDAPTAAAPTVSVSDTVVSEKQGYAEFVVTLSAPSTQAVKVNYITAIGSAYDDYRGPDYAYPGAQTLNFAPGETVKTVRVALFDDTTAEGTESFYLNLYAPTNGVLGKSQGTATIVDNDAAKGTPVLSVTDTVVDEKTGRAYITLTLDKPSASTVSVTVATADGSAVAGTDYQALPSQTVGFAPGEMSKTIAVNLIDDASAESGEFFNLVLSGASGATLPDNRAIVSIGASDAPTAAAPTVSVSDTVVSEKQGYAEFVVTLSAPSTQAVKVNYITAIGSAYDDYRGPDYAYPGAQTLNFAPGETVKTVRVALFDDTTAEGTESFYLNLYAPTNGVLGKSQGTATIVDNDAAKGTPVLSVTDTVVDEKTGRAYITLTLDKPSASTVSVTVATADGSAVAGTDYQALPSQTVGFAPGEMSKTIAVNLIDDASAESGEFFNLVLSGASGATLPDNRAIVSIGASDAPTAAAPTVSVSDTVVSEKQGYAEFVVTLSAPSTQAVKVNYITAIGSAYDDYRGPDYAYPGAQTLNFAPGETVKTVRVALFDDTTAEGTESFYLNLYAPTNGVLGKSQGTATIVDNDAAKGTPVLSVTDTVVDEKTGRAYITLTLDKPSASTVSVTVATADGSAVAGTDYQALPSQTVGFAPGEMSKTIAVNLIDDASAESGEFFNLVLSGASGATLPDNRAIVSIGASDAPTAAAPTVSVSDTVVSEKQGYAEFVVTLSAPSTQAVKVNYITAIGSAYDDYRGPDYAYPGAQTLNFAPGETVKTVRVALFDDTTAEGTESFYLNLYAPTNGVLGKSQGTATIYDDDALLSGGGTVAGVIESAGNVDSFAVSLTAGTNYTIGMRGAPSANGTLADPYFRGVYAADGTYVFGTANDDFAGGAESRSTFTPTISGTYYLAAGAYGGGIGTYTLSISGQATPDISASISSVATITLGGTLRSSIGVPGDVDWVKASLVSGQTYAIELASDRNTSNPLSDPNFVGIYSSDGTLISNTSNDDYGTGLDSRLEFTPTASGTYYLAAGGFESSTGAYTLRLLSTVQTADTVGGTPATAAALTLGTPRSGTINFARDVDWFKVDLAAGQTYAVDLRGAPSGNGTLANPDLIGITNSAGTMIPGTGNDDALGTVDSHELFRPATSGTYYFAIAAANDGIGTYRVSVEATPAVSDLPSDATTTASLTASAAVQSDIGGPGDVDWVKVSLIAGTSYAIDMLGADTNSGTLVHPLVTGVLDAQGHAVSTTRYDPFGYGSDASLNLVAPETGTYYVAAAAGGNATGSYRLTLSPGPADTRAPTLVGASPADGATAVQPGSNLTIDFSEAVHAGSGNILISGGGTTRTIAVTDSSQVSFAGSTMTINPLTNLASGGDYFVTFGAGAVRDLSGNAFAGVTSSSDFNFRTAGAAAEEWTIMVYMAADNELESAAIADLNEMESVLLPGNVNVVVLFDRARGHDTSNGDWTDTRIGHITHDTDLANLDTAFISIGESDTGDGSTLTDFINRTVASDPAGKYALIVWDHGGGLDGTCWDDTSLRDNLHIEEMSAAISASNRPHLDLIAFDACSQGMIEQAWALRDISDVVVASEEIVPGSGFAYDQFLARLGTDTNQSSFDLATNIVETYGQSFGGFFHLFNDETLSAVRTHGLDALKVAIDNFASASIASGAKTIDSLLEAAGRATEFDGGTGDARDLGDFMHQVISSVSDSATVAAAHQVLTAIEGAVLTSTGDVAGATGLSVYLPLHGIASTYVPGPGGFTFLEGTSWGNFLRFMQQDTRADHLVGDETANDIRGFGGDDTIMGLEGDDTLDGGDGLDSLDGGVGVDRVSYSQLTSGVVADLGTGVVASGAGPVLDNLVSIEWLTGTSSSDSLTGNSAANRLSGLGSTDRLVGLGGNDTLIGGASADTLVGGDNNDSLTGGAGDDTFLLDSKIGSDVIADFHNVIEHDRVSISMSRIKIGDGDTTVTGPSTPRDAPGGFASTDELVLFTDAVSTLTSTTEAAVAIGSASSAYSIGRTALFAVHNSAGSALFLFTAADANATVSASELTLLASFTGGVTTTPSDYLFVP